jgi:5'-nucleotidase
MEELQKINRRNFIKAGGITGAAFALNLTSFDSFASGRLRKITILHTNDVHSRIEPFPMDGSKNQGLGGTARRAALISKIRSEQENVLLLDAGDIFQGTMMPQRWATMILTMASPVFASSCQMQTFLS